MAGLTRALRGPLLVSVVLPAARWAARTIAVRQGWGTDKPLVRRVLGIPEPVPARRGLLGRR